MSRPKSVPERDASVLPYLGVRVAVLPVDFYKAAYGAKSKVALAMPDSRPMHPRWQKLENGRVAFEALRRAEQIED